MNKYQLINNAKSLRDVLKTIEDLLENYPGIPGNENYVKYCYKKAKAGNETNLAEILDYTYNIDLTKRKEVSYIEIQAIINYLFCLLDAISSAGDIFKPKWCKITNAVEYLHRLRWLYCTK